MKKSQKTKVESKPTLGINVKLFRQIKKRILDEPRQFDMSMFFNTDPYMDIPNCGTAACIAGWAITLSKTPDKKPSTASHAYHYSGDILDGACKELGISPSQGERLFFDLHWPRPYGTEFREQSKQSNKTGQAKVAARFIDEIIKTNGKILD